MYIWSTNYSCPSCGQILTFTQIYETDVQTFECPNCKRTIRTINKQDKNEISLTIKVL